MGWSYGGFIAAWAAGHSDRLKAISIGAPVTDLLSYHGTADIRDFIPSYFLPPRPHGLELRRLHRGVGGGPQRPAESDQHRRAGHRPPQLPRYRRHPRLHPELFSPASASWAGATAASSRRGRRATATG